MEGIGKKDSVTPYMGIQEKMSLSRLKLNILSLSLEFQLKTHQK